LVFCIIIPTPCHLYDQGNIMLYEEGTWSNYSEQ
jgi:hypothetical protein